MSIELFSLSVYEWMREVERKKSRNRETEDSYWALDLYQIWRVSRQTFDPEYKVRLIWYLSNLLSFYTFEYVVKSEKMLVFSNLAKFNADKVSWSVEHLVKWDWF